MERMGGGSASRLFLSRTNYLLGEFRSFLPANGVVDHQTRGLQWAWPKGQQASRRQTSAFSDEEMLERV